MTIRDRIYRPARVPAAVSYSREGGLGTAASSLDSGTNGDKH
jgi:hypothetical protein